MLIYVYDFKNRTTIISGVSRRSIIKRLKNNHLSIFWGGCRSLESYIERLIGHTDFTIEQ